MLETIIGIIIVGLILLAWINASHAREAALAYGHRFCKERQIQMLDGSVALSKWRIKRVAATWKIYREYVFDYTQEGTLRHKGKISILGRELIDINLHVFEKDLKQDLTYDGEIDITPKKQQDEHKATVIDFNKFKSKKPSNDDKKE